jgi:L-cysteate sulfo-lyase
LSQPPDILRRFPRLPVALTPTPLLPLDGVRAALGPHAPRLLIKRDDLTGLALGGNKARKLDYLLADARRQGADTLLTCGAAQSNHALQTAAAGRRFGFAVQCILDGPAPEAATFPTGNLRLHQLLDTPIIWATLLPGETRREQARRRVLAEEADRVRSVGGLPYVIPTGGSTPIGALGYVQAVAEVRQQLKALDSDPPTTVFFASGSGGTQAGMMVGARREGWTGALVGVEVDPMPPDAAGYNPYQRAVHRLTNETATLLETPADFDLTDITLCPDYAGPAYGVSTPEGEEAIRLLATTEGIFLDPVYSGKAFAALLGWVRAGRFHEDDTVLFWHTGGVAGLFTAHG